MYNAAATAVCVHFKKSKSARPVCNEIYVIVEGPLSVHKTHTQTEQILGNAEKTHVKVKHKQISL